MSTFIKKQAPIIEKLNFLADSLKEDYTVSCRFKSKNGSVINIFSIYKYEKLIYKLSLPVYPTNPNLDELSNAVKLIKSNMFQSMIELT